MPISASTLPHGEVLAREFAEGRMRPATVDELISIGVTGSRTSVYHYVKAGKLEAIRVGGRYYIPAGVVRRLLGVTLPTEGSDR